MSIRLQTRPELWEAISKPYGSGVYSSAILEAIHHLSDVLRERANVDGDGVSLVGQALGGDSPRLRINRFQTETEKSEQRGVQQILMGIYQGIRNPRSHEQFEDDQAAADAIILFINYILGIISQAKQPFNLDEWIERVYDADFVASDRYAQLLASEVSRKKYNEALIAIYGRKMEGDGEKLKYVVEALIQLAGDDQISDFLAVVSDDLKVVQDDQVVKTVLQLLPDRLWPRIEEAARLRIEHKLIRSIEAAKDSSREAGWLATWGQHFIKYFTLKDQLRQALLRKLRGSVHEQNYVAEFFLWQLPDTIDANTGRFMRNHSRDEYIEAVAEAASDPSGAQVLREKLTALYELPSDWRDLLIEKLEALKETDSEYYRKVVQSKDEEIPF